MSDVSFPQLISNEENFNQFKMETIENQCLVHIDSAALNALSVIPQSQVTAINKHHSVFGLLDRCRTSHGRRYDLRVRPPPLIHPTPPIVCTLTDDSVPVGC